MYSIPRPGIHCWESKARPKDEDFADDDFQDSFLLGLFGWDRMGYGIYTGAMYVVRR